MDLNFELINEMIDRLDQIAIEMHALRELQSKYPGMWDTMLAVNRQYKALKVERICIMAMLEDEYEQLDINEVLFELY